MSFRAFFLSLTVTTMLFYSVVGTTTVYADDGTTEPATTETPAPPEEGQPVETVLEQLPENTTVTVLSAEGEALPLASQETADAIESAYDPIWCPAGQDPTPNANGCTESFESFSLLLSFLVDHENDVADDLTTLLYQEGTIYIQQGAYQGGESEIDFNDYSFTSLNNYDLTLQGGWDTNWDSTDPLTPYPDYTTTTFNAPITIGSGLNPWVGSLKIKDISIDGVTNQTGLTVYSENNIILSDVEVTNSQSGANLDAGGYVDVSDSKFNNNAKGGADIQADGDAYVYNSEFNNNGSTKTNGYGVKINSGGEVDLFETSASFNEIFGADVTAGGPVYVDISVFSGNVSYSYSCKGKTPNGGYGLKVVSQSDVTVNFGNIPGDGIEANDNYEFGASLEGNNVQVAYSTFSNNGSGSESKPTGSGLKVISTSDALLSNVEANNNQLFGANIDAGGYVTVIDSFFNGNMSYTSSCKGKTYNGYGIQVVTDGFISITNVTANENNLFGAHLDGAGVSVAFSSFSNNGLGSTDITGKGLEVISTDYVSLANVTANDNELFGADVQATGNVTISNSFFNGQKVYTYSCKSKSVAGGGYGLKVVTEGQIDITAIEASDNYSFGTSLDGLSIAITGGTFDRNNEGLNIKSDTTVSLASIQANQNGKSGATVEAGDRVSITDGLFNGNKSYTYSCQGNSSSGYGLKVVTTGFISLSNVSANDNNLFGAHLEGSGVSIFSSAFSDTDTVVDQAKGLEVISSGNQTVSLYQVNADNNKEFGANIASDGYVSISDSTFSGNVSYTSGSCKSTTYSGYGLKVVTTNNIYLYNVTANDNGTFGASLDGVDVSVTDSTFNNNKTSNGLTITADTATLNNVTALNNGGNGAKICATISADVNASDFENNSQYGLSVGSPVFNEGVNTYISNGSGSVFYSPSCATSSTGGNNNGGWGWGWNWNHYKPQTGYGHGHGTSYNGGSCNKSQHAYGKKW